MASSTFEVLPRPRSTFDAPIFPKSLSRGSQEEGTRHSARSSITAHQPASTSTITLHTTTWPILIALLYSAFAITPWVILCIMSQRPIKHQKSYDDSEEWWYTDVYSINQKYLKTAHVLRTIVTLLTIPATSAICSMAAVAFMQRGASRKSLKLNQVMALADHGWFSRRLPMYLSSAGSPLFYLAFALTIIGSASQIMQDAFVGQETIKAATHYSNRIMIKDIVSLLNQTTLFPAGEKQIYRLRSLLESSSEDDWDASIWNEPIASPYSNVIEHGLKVFEPDYAMGIPSFVAELPYNFSTGVVASQYAPRISSTTHFNIIEQFSNNFDALCRNETDAGGFYAIYNYNDPNKEADESDHAVTVCMPGDKRVSPWRATRDRQDISEDLYLFVTIPGYGESMYKATVNSTLGYFELPSYKNGYRSGPVLDKDPFTKDSEQISHLDYLNKRAIEPNTTYSGNLDLLEVSNKGPLCALALALFGKGSFIEVRASGSSTYNATTKSEYSTTLEPLAFFHSSGSLAYGSPSGQMSSVLMSITDSFHRTLPMVVFLANKLWLGPSNKDDQVLKVAYDPGVDTVKPRISKAGIIVSSVFLGMHLLGLWLLAVYTMYARSWVTNLGAEAMLRLGSHFAEALDGLDKKEWNKVVAKLPGFIGDASPEGVVGRMKMGASAELRFGRRYEAL